MNSHAYREAPHGHVRDEDLPKAPPAPPDERSLYEKILDLREEHGLALRALAMVLLPIAVIAGPVLAIALMPAAYLVTGDLFGSFDPIDFSYHFDRAYRLPLLPGTRALYTGSDDYKADLRRYCERRRAKAKAALL